MYLEPFLIKFKLERVGGDYETIKNGKIIPIFRSIADIDGDKGKGHSSLGFLSEYIGVCLQRPGMRIVFFHFVFKALEDLSKH